MTVKRVLGGLALAGIATLAIAGEPYVAGQRTLLGPPMGERAPGDGLAELGRKLFYETRLSASGRTACASCHPPDYVFADPRRVSVSDTGRPGTRNAPSLVNARFQPKLMLDGRIPTLEQQAVSPFLRGEMGISLDAAVARLKGDPEYVHLFQLVLAGEPTVEGMASAIAAYERTLVSGESRFERFLLDGETGALTPLEREGFAVFNAKARCSSCHLLFQPGFSRARGEPLLLTDFGFHNLGIGYRSGRFADLGRYQISQTQSDVGAFRTPSLRNVALTGPYMHDGSLATLEEVVEFYDRGGRANPNLSDRIRPLSLAEHEKRALVAFLRSLTDREHEFGRPEATTLRRDIDILKKIGVPGQ